MAQFDVYRNLRESTKEAAPYLIDLQSDLLGELATRVVAPLMREGVFAAATRLHPTFAIEGVRVVLAVERLAAIDRRELRERVLSLDDRRFDIIAATDVLITGV
jgi:toxin CcdB